MTAAPWYETIGLPGAVVRATAPASEGMAAILGLEAIGDNIRSTHPAAIRAMFRMRTPENVRKHLLLDDHRPWVAKITGKDSKYGLRREFLTSRKDYSQANAQGSRGVFLYYTLREGHMYDVHELTNWGKDRRYFVAARAGAVVELTKDEVDTWRAKL